MLLLFVCALHFLLCFDSVGQWEGHLVYEIPIVSIPRSSPLRPGPTFLTVPRKILGRFHILRQESLADTKVSARQQCVYEDPYRRNLQQICN